MLSFAAMKHKPFRKPQIRKFGDMRRLTRLQPTPKGAGTQLQGDPYDQF